MGGADDSIMTDIRLRVRSSHVFDVLERVERKGFAIAGLYTLDGDATLTICAPSAEHSHSFLRALNKTALPDGAVPLVEEAVLPAKADDDAGAKEAEDPKTHQMVLAVLAASGALYGSSEHAPVRTSEEAAIERGATLASGAKAMLLSVKPQERFVLAVISV